MTTFFTKIASFLTVLALVASFSPMAAHATPGDTFDPLPPASAEFPEDGETYTSAEVTKIDWSDAEDAVSYTYEVSFTDSADGDFSAPVYDQSNITASELPTSGNADGVYYWHIKTTDDENNVSAWSETFMFTIAPPPAPGDGGIWYVDDSNAGSEDGTLAAPFNTIQEAVDAASAGHTVMVADGIYPEQVVLTKALTLSGENAGSDARTRSGAESIVDGGGSQTPFVIQANDVTIDGFTITGGQNGGYYSGIWMADPTNASILNNIFTDNNFGIWADCSGSCLIENNLFASDVAGPSGTAAISADSTVGLTIRDNEFENQDEGNPVLLQATGAGSHTDVTATGNSFHDNAFSNLYILGVSGGVFSGNSLDIASDATGFSFSGGNDSIEVSDNDISNGARGIRIEDAGYGLGGNTNFVITENRISGNTEYGVGFTETTGTVDATTNWWGHSTGPTVASNAGGEGDALVEATAGSVSYVPWCTNEACTTLNTDVVENNNGGGNGRGRSGSGGGNRTNTNSNVNANASVTGQVNGTTPGVGQVLGASTYNFTVDLSYGSTGPDVVALQQMLIDAGLLKIAAPTGWFGPMTRAALAQWQAAHGVMPAVGYFGPITRAAILAANAVSTPTTSTTTTTTTSN